MRCIYVAIGQKTSTISHIVKTLEEKGAMAEIASRENWCDQATKKAIIEILQAYHYDLSIDFDKEVLADIMRKDKKRKGAFLDLVVPRTIGDSRLHRIPTEELETLL